MKLTLFCLYIGLLLLSALGFSQEKKHYKIQTIAFYNFENLFDTSDDPDTFDESSPLMELKIDRENVFKLKIKNMARVISDIGKDSNQNSPTLVGVAEIENRTVLEHLLNDSLLINKDYGIIHYESPDTRGIDVALLYQKQLFKPTSSSKHEVKIYDTDTGNRHYTRDILLVSGFLENEPIHVLVNHWPSRRGGETKSRKNRMKAASVTKRITDSLQTINPYAKIIIMGDLNDDPTNASLKKVLKTQKDIDKLALKDIFNPYEAFYNQGQGTTAYRDSWSLFDQILISKPLTEKDFSTYNFYKAAIFNKNYLITQSGTYKGYPLRSFSNGGFSNGFSDHFPVYIYLIKEVSVINTNGNK